MKLINRALDDARQELGRQERNITPVDSPPMRSTTYFVNVFSNPFPTRPKSRT